MQIIQQIEKNEQQSFIINNQEKIYQRNNQGNPLIYEINIETIGFYENKSIMEKGLTILEEKINLYDESSEDIELENGFYILKIDNQNDTLGNLISSYINDEKDIQFSGYIIEHPLYENIILKIKTDLNKTDLLKLITEKNNYIKELIHTLKKELK
jgi:DNA-directed RNA polymerase subunit L